MNVHDYLTKRITANRYARIARLREIGAPDVIVANERKELETVDERCEKMLVKTPDLAALTVRLVTDKVGRGGRPYLVVDTLEGTAVHVFFNGGVPGPKAYGR